MPLPHQVNYGAIENTGEYQALQKMKGVMFMSKIPFHT